MGVQSKKSVTATPGAGKSRRLYTAAVILALHHLGGRVTIPRLERYTGMSEYNLYRICAALESHGLLIVHNQEKPISYSIPAYEEVRKHIAAVTTSSAGGDNLSGV